MNDPVDLTTEELNIQGIMQRSGEDNQEKNTEKNTPETNIDKPEVHIRREDIGKHNLNDEAPEIDILYECTKQEDGKF